VTCVTCVSIELLGSWHLAVLKERLLRRFNMEPVFISILLVSEIDVETEVVVAETYSDDPLARLRFGQNLEIKLFIVSLVCLFVKAAALPLPSKQGAWLKLRNYWIGYKSTIYFAGPMSW